MKHTRLLDKVSNEYYQRQRRFEMPGWILGVIGLILLLLGAFRPMIILMAIGILLLAMAIYLIIMGRIVHKTLKK